MITNKIRLQKGFERVFPYNFVSGEYLIRVETSEYDEHGFCDGVELLVSGGKPTLERIKEIVMGWIDGQTDERILSGHTYEGHLVWLSAENQLNYKAAYDLAVQFKGKHGTLPLVFKLGTTEAPIYREFSTLEDLTQFYLGVVAHKTSCLTAGWQRKDNINWDLYEQAIQD